MFAAIDFSSFMERDFSLKALGLTRYFVYAELRCGRAIIELCPAPGSSWIETRALFLNIGGVSINEPTEVFNHPRFGIFINLEVEPF
jgi:hypothetical protein